MSNDYLTSVQAAEILGITDTTLRRWRWENKGPKYYKIHTRVRYKKEDVENFIERNEQVPEEA